MSRPGAEAPPGRRSGFLTPLPGPPVLPGATPGIVSREASSSYLRSESEPALLVGRCVVLRCDARALDSQSRSPPTPSRPDAPTFERTSHPRFYPPAGRSNGGMYSGLTYGCARPDRRKSRLRYAQRNGRPADRRRSRLHRSGHRVDAQLHGSLPPLGATAVGGLGPRLRPRSGELGGDDRGRQEVRDLDPTAVLQRRGASDGNAGAVYLGRADAGDRDLPDDPDGGRGPTCRLFRPLVARGPGHL